MPARMPRFTVECEDEDYYFKFGRVLKERQVLEIFEQRIQPWKSYLFPGLRLKDDAGNLLVPKLQVVLVPAKES